MALKIDIIKDPYQIKKIARKKAILKTDKIIIGTPIFISLLLIGTAGILIAHIDSKNNILQKKKEKIEREIHDIEREIENAKNKIEAASGINIKRQVAKLNLDLDLPQWKQRRKLDLNIISQNTQIINKKIAEKKLVRRKEM
ncbi:MAG TPA: hypothetical protein P5105_03070 [Victivallales bacterium]|nr:hypothetical protein [Victivallales bacterium]HPO91433.1 hypothetical protein [Victivallales bacterium]HRR06242.1 hypothetical protein [Victivallales bacterium]